MELDVARHYLRETCRVLKPGGHAVFSIFGLTAEMIAPAGGVTALHGKGGENSPYAYRFKDHGDGFYGHCDVEGNPKSHHLAGDLVGDPVAYDIDAFGRHCREAGFTVASVLLGGWCRPEYLHGYQDMFVLRKPGGTTPPGGVADAALAPDGSAASPPASDPRLRDLRKLIRFLESRLAEETDARKRSVREAGSLRKQLAAGRRALDRLMEHVVRLRRNPLTRPFARSALLDEVRQVKQTLAPPPARPETNERRSDAT